MPSSSSPSPSPAVGLKDVIYKVQLNLLEGIESETQLLVAGSLLSKSDYHDVVVERSIAQMCGYPLCINKLLPSSGPPKKGRYSISLKEHKVYDLLETRMYCSTKCAVDSRGFEESLQEERSLDFEIDKVFEGLNLKGEKEGSDLLLIKEKDGDEKGAIVSMEEWVGPSNAVEGYVPQHDRISSLRNKQGSKVKDVKLEKKDKVEQAEGFFSEINFMSSIITQGDEYNVSKLPTKMKKKHTKSKDKDNGPSEDQPSCSNGGLKSCLKDKSSSDAVKRNVTWADDDRTQISGNEKEESYDRLASTEVFAQPEPQPISSGNDDSVEGAVEPEPAQLKWPKKTGIVESDFFDSEDSWFDTPPEEFVLDLSPFATMFMSLFAWVSSSTLAYVYGAEDISHEEYASINGREYPRKIVLTDGRSSEIKQTLAACLARALPGLVLHLRLPTPVSTIEYGMGCLLETMSFLDPLPALRMKQWQVFILLFLEALSVSRIPALAPHLANKAAFFHKVVEDGKISREEYEVLKDLMLPLGPRPRLPSQFAMESGA